MTPVRTLLCVVLAACTTLARAQDDIGKTNTPAAQQMPQIITKDGVLNLNSPNGKRHAMHALAIERGL